MHRHPAPHLRYFFRQIVEGLSYCHTCHIAHRDLKLSNFLLTADNPPRSAVLQQPQASFPAKAAAYSADAFLCTLRL